ncbi:MAG: phosphatase PAP2 family protein [Acidobacteriota bacterium]
MCMVTLRGTAGRPRVARAAVLFVALTLAASVRASARDPGDRPYWRRNLFKRFLLDQKFLVTRWWPGELRHRSFVFPLALATAAATASGGAEPGADYRLERSIQGWDDGKGVARGLSLLGEGKTAAVLVGGAYLVARWRRDERLARSASLTAEALLNVGLWSVAMKRLTRRTRPVADGQGDFFVDRAEPGQSTNSFPSGHAMGAFAAATVFAQEYRDKRWVSWVAYGTAGLIGASRVSLGRHFPSDVVVGAMLGRSIGRMVSARQQEAAGRIADRFRPVIDPVSGGYGLAYVHFW